MASPGFVSQAADLQLKQAVILYAGLSRDAIVAGTAKGILSSMPRAWDMPSVRKGLGSVISPTEVVLLQELEHYNQVHPRRSFYGLSPPAMSRCCKSAHKPQMLMCLQTLKYEGCSLSDPDCFCGKLLDGLC